MKTNKEIALYIPLIEGVVKLFHPFIEAAVHDLKTGKITALYNNLSKRKIGDSSPLQELGLPVEKFPDNFDPYYKTNWDGRKLKCTSITIRNEKNDPIALICFNFDTTVFGEMQINVSTLLEVKTTAENPIELFKDNWQKKIDQYIKQSLNGSYSQLRKLPNDEKKTIVQNLYKHGLFNYKNAALYIAEKLDISRASVYNYLKS